MELQVAYYTSAMYLKQNDTTLDVKVFYNVLIIFFNNLNLYIIDRHQQSHLHTEMLHASEISKQSQQAIDSPSPLLLTYKMVWGWLFLKLSSGGGQMSSNLPTEQRVLFLSRKKTIYASHLLSIISGTAAYYTIFHHNVNVHIQSKKYK